MSLPLVWQDLNTLWQTMDVDGVGHVDEVCVLPCLVGETSERRKDCVRKVCADSHRHARAAHVCTCTPTPTHAGMQTCTANEVIQQPFICSVGLDGVGGGSVGGGSVGCGGVWCVVGWGVGYGVWWG